MDLIGLSVSVFDYISDDSRSPSSLTSQLQITHVLKIYLITFSIPLPTTTTDVLYLHISR